MSRNRKGPPRAQPGKDPDVSAEETLLATWTAVFPLSRGPAHRVRLHAGPKLSAELVSAISADYVRALGERVPSTCRVDDDGALRGPRDFDGLPHDVLFAAAFTTDLDQIVRRHAQPDSSRTDHDPELPGRRG